MLFASFCLDVIVPSPDVASSVAIATFQAAVEGAQSVDEIHTYSLSHLLLEALFVNLLCPSLEVENKAPVIDGIEQAARNALADPAASSLDIQVRLAIGLMRWSAAEFDEFERWENFLRQFGSIAEDDVIQDRIRRLGKIRREWERGLITGRELVAESIEVCVHPIRIVP